jgi:C4-dicarboxylate-specific signal transduction histidine kinase
MEAPICILAAELEHRVQLRTAELLAANQQLEQAQPPPMKAELQ